MRAGGNPLGCAAARTTTSLIRVSALPFNVVLTAIFGKLGACRGFA
jgi:hypothetical protein